MKDYMRQLKSHIKKVDLKKSTVTLELTIECPMCKKHFYFTLDRVKYKAWEKGELIQEALSELSADDRQQLISGHCVNCYNQLRADEEYLIRQADSLEV